MTFDIPLTIQPPVFIHKSMDWFKGKIMGNTHSSSYFIIFHRKIYRFPHISKENLLFPPYFKGKSMVSFIFHRKIPIFHRKIYGFPVAFPYTPNPLRQRRLHGFRAVQCPVDQVPGDPEFL